MGDGDAVNLGMPAYGFKAFTPTGSGMWYACEEPEREPNPWVLWHYRDCAGCAIKANAALVHFPADANVQRILGPIARQLDELAR